MRWRSTWSMGKRILHLGALALALALAAPGVLADPSGGTIARLDQPFDHYSPLAKASVLLDRVFTPLPRERVREQAITSAKPLGEQSLDLHQERFSVYVPTDAAPAAGYGVLVFVSPRDKAEIESRWRPVLARHQLIAVVAANAGNAASVLDRRLPLALTAYENIRLRYRIDPARVYVGGFSGGARVALRLALGFPDVFRGALLNSGSDPIGTSAVPLPDARLFRLFEERSRLVYVTGSRDAGVLSADINSRDSARALCFFDWVTLTMHGRGHEYADSATLARAFDALDAPRTDEAHAQECRVARDHDIAQRLAAIARHIDAGETGKATRQLEALDAHFGGLAAPGSVKLRQRISGAAARAAGNPR